MKNANKGTPGQNPTHAKKSGEPWRANEPEQSEKCWKIC